MTATIATQRDLCERHYVVCRRRHLPSKVKWKELRDLTTRCLRQERRVAMMTEKLKADTAARKEREQRGVAA